MPTTGGKECEVPAYFKASGPGWQTRIDAVLREYARLAAEARS